MGTVVTPRFRTVLEVPMPLAKATATEAVSCISSSWFRLDLEPRGGGEDCEVRFRMVLNRDLRSSPNQTR